MGERSARFREALPEVDAGKGYALHYLLPSLVKGAEGVEDRLEHRVELALDLVEMVARLELEAGLDVGRKGVSL